MEIVQPNFIQSETRQPKNPLTELVPVSSEILDRALTSDGFADILTAAKNLSEPELSQNLATDLKDSYEDLGSDCPGTIEELQQRLIISQQNPEQTTGSRNPLTANTLDYFNQRLTTITSLAEIIKEKPILLHLLIKEQQRLAHLIVSLEKFLPTEEQATQAAA